MSDGVRFTTLDMFLTVIVTATVTFILTSFVLVVSSGPIRIGREITQTCTYEEYYRFGFAKTITIPCEVNNANQQ